MWWGGGYSEGGVWGTRDGGAAWTQLDQGLTLPSVTSLWLDQSDPSVLLAATPVGVFRTTTGGTSWSLVLDGTYRQVIELGGLLYAGGFSGLQVSRDQGTTWSPLLGPDAQVTALGGSGSTLYVGLFDGSILVADGAGATPQRVFAGSGTGAPGWGFIAVDPANPRIAYAADTPHAHLDRTTDGGRTWREIDLPTNRITASWAVRTVATDPGNADLVLVGGDEILYRSTDGGATFSELPVGVDIWELDPVSGTSGEFLAVTDQGLYVVTNGGDDWRSVNGNLSTGLIWAVVAHGSTVLARQQDFSVTASFDGGNSWQMLTAAGGEDGDLALNPANPQYVYGMGTNDGLTYSSDGGHDWVSVPAVPAEDFSAGNQVIGVDPSHPANVYAATANGVYASTDWGIDWSQTGWPFTRTQLVAVDPKDSSHIFVGTHSADGASGTLSYSTDGGTTWRQVAATGAAGYPTSLDFDPSGKIVLGTSQGLAVSSDGGASFTADAGGLPELPTVLGSEPWPAVEALADVSSGSAHVIVAATTAGVFAQPAGGARWTDVSGSLLSRFVHDVNQDGDSVYVATYGQGVLRTDATAIVDAVEAASVSVSTHRVTISVTGHGRVVSIPVGVNCPGRCSVAVTAGKGLTLHAKARPGYRFAGWSRGCPGSAATCRLRPTADVEVAARFVRR